MSVEIKMMPGERILIQTNGQDYSFSKEGRGAAEQLVKLLDQQDRPVVYIMNLLAVNNISFEDLVVGSNMAIEQFSMFKHPKMLAGIIVTDNTGLTLAAKGLNSEAFGNTQLLVFKTLDEALQTARDILRQ